MISLIFGQSCISISITLYKFAENTQNRLFILFSCVCICIYSVSALWNIVIAFRVLSCNTLLSQWQEVSSYNYTTVATTMRHCEYGYICMCMYIKMCHIYIYIYIYIYTTPLIYVLNFFVKIFGCLENLIDSFASSTHLICMSASIMF